MKIIAYSVRKDEIPYFEKFAKEFGVKENLKSPTFNYVLEYLTGRLPLYHFDVYRLPQVKS